MVAPQLIVNEVVEQSVSTSYLPSTEYRLSPQSKPSPPPLRLPIVSPRKEPAVRFESSKRLAPEPETAPASKRPDRSEKILNPATALVMEEGVNHFMGKSLPSVEPKCIVESPSNSALDNKHDETPSVSPGHNGGPPCHRSRKVEKSVARVKTVAASAALSHIDDSIGQIADCGTATVSPCVPTARPAPKATDSRVVVASATLSPVEDSPAIQEVDDLLDSSAPASSAIHEDQFLGPSLPIPEMNPVDCSRTVDESWPPPDAVLMTAIRAALNWSPPPRSQPIFDFRLSAVAAQRNFEILREHNFDLNAIIFSDPRSIVRPGSEFRPTSLLEPILQGHPLWPRFRQYLHIGAAYPVDPISDDDRLADLVAAIEYGNHKSARTQGEMLLGILDKEVSKGWQLPLPVDKLLDIPRCVVGPLGVAHQETIDAFGQRIPKDRVTHDQSFVFASGRSVNNRVRTEELTQCRYGFALRRFIHLIVALRARYPDIAILLSKFDFKSAYRRVHSTPDTVLQSVVTTKGLGGDDIALASLRLPFGGSPCPSLFSDISEPTTDLANAIARCPAWDPLSLPSPYSELIGSPQLLDSTIDFAPAKPMIVDPDPDEFGGADVYLDDVFSAVPALSEMHSRRGYEAVLLAIAVIGRPLSEDEKVLRDELLAIEKALAEGTPTELLIVLGWELDTRRLRINLPLDKFLAWSADIDFFWERAVKGLSVSYDQMKTLVGRLQHVANVLVPASHFMSRLRAAEARAERHKFTRLTANERGDLQLWKAFLVKVRDGVDLNLLTCREPEFIYRTDACPAGIGGYSLTTGRAWQWAIPEEFYGYFSQNFLEFLGCVVGIKLSLLEDDVPPAACLLSLTDNTSAMGWLRKSNFPPDGEQAFHFELARELAELLLQHDVCLYSQWFAGIDNEVADFLSRVFGISAADLTRHLLATFPAQVPKTFKVSPLPDSISSELLVWMQRAKQQMGSPKHPMPKPTPPGSDGFSFWDAPSSSTIPSSPDSPERKSTDCWAALPSPFEQGTTVSPQRAMTSWFRAHVVPPSTVWRRPSSPPDTPIQG